MSRLAANSPNIEQSRLSQQRSEEDIERDKVLRQLEVAKYIDEWKQTTEYQRLGENAREVVIDFMMGQNDKQSETYLWLSKLTDYANTHISGSRVPFYEQ